MDPSLLFMFSLVMLSYDRFSRNTVIVCIGREDILEFTIGYFRDLCFLSFVVQLKPRHIHVPYGVSNITEAKIVIHSRPQIAYFFFPYIQLTHNTSAKYVCTFVVYLHNFIFFNFSQNRRSPEFFFFETRMSTVSSLDFSCHVRINPADGRTRVKVMIKSRPPEQ